MGLDMYLQIERPIPDAQRELVLAAAAKADPKDPTGAYLAGWGFYSDAERQPFIDVVTALDLKVTADAPSASVIGGEVISWNVAYWRKANAVHDWFVKNCADGVDDCDPVAVTWEQAAHLHATAVRAAAAYDRGDRDAAAALLEPTAGFFFGSTDVDEWYRDDLQRTIDQLDEMFRQLQSGDRIIYQASW